MNIIKRKSKINYNDFEEAMSLLGFERSSTNPNKYSQGDEFKINVEYIDNNSPTVKIKYEFGNSYVAYTDIDTIGDMISRIENILEWHELPIFSSILLTESIHRHKVMAAVSTKDIANRLVRVRSSNVWAYGIDVKDRKRNSGDVIVQFKNPSGGAGDIYIYYDVPIMIYRRWQSATSKGHYFWIYIRDNYRYSKLTGDKRGHLPNAVN